MYDNFNRIIEISCSTNRIIEVVIPFVLVGTCLHYNFRLVTVQRSITLHEKCPNAELFLVRIFPYSVQIRYILLRFS